MSKMGKQATPFFLCLVEFFLCGSSFFLSLVFFFERSTRWVEKKTGHHVYNLQKKWNSFLIVYLSEGGVPYHVISTCLFFYGKEREIFFAKYNY